MAIWKRGSFMKGTKTLTEEVFGEIDAEIVNHQRIKTRSIREELLQKFKMEEITQKEFEKQLLKIYCTRFQDSRTTITVSFRLPPEQVVFLDTQIVNGEFVNRSEMVRTLIHDYKKYLDTKTE